MADISDLLVTDRSKPAPSKPHASPLMDAYSAWTVDPSPERLQDLMAGLDPVITSEIQRFSGPKPLLKSRAKALAIQAVRKYDPNSGVQLRSWVTTQLQPLSRYNNSLKPVYTPEDAARKSYAVSKAHTDFINETGRDPTDDELADRVGISVKRLQAVRRMTPAVVNEPTPTDDESASPEYGIYQSNTARAAAEAVYSSLDARDKRIYDLRTGEHGASETSGVDIASLLKISPALVTRRSDAIAQQILEATGRMQQ